MRQLIATADDVGLDPGMTAGAIEAHRKGIVTACSIVANGRAFDDAIARLRDVPALEVGVHLTLVEERALTTGEPMPRNWMRFLLSQRGDVEGEMRLQIEKVLAAGVRVTHLNSHQHLHMMYFDLVRELATEYDIKYVRAVNDHGGRGPLLRRAIFKAIAKPGRTIGVLDAGGLTPDRLLALLDHVEGTTELVAHPGINVHGYTHWRYAWDTETRALCDPRVREAISTRGIALVAPSKV